MTVPVVPAIVPVEVVAQGPGIGASYAAEFEACNTFTLQQLGALTMVPLVPILNRRETRDKAYIFVVAAGGASAIIFATDGSRLSGLVGTTLPPQGSFGAIPVPAVSAVEWNSQQPCYALGVGGTPIVSTFDATFAHEFYVDGTG
jgi:hypothetical protein